MAKTITEMMQDWYHENHQQLLRMRRDQVVNAAFEAGWSARVRSMEQAPREKQKGKTLCEQCDGTGWVPAQLCAACGGRGWRVDVTGLIVRCNATEECRTDVPNFKEIIERINRLDRKEGV